MTCLRGPEAIASLVLLALAGCATEGRFVWVDDLRPAPEPAQAAAYVIGTGDLLSVRVWNQDAMSARVRVRPDGQISLPFLNDVTAAGYAPTVLAQQLQTRLKDFINAPVVTISLEETRPVSIPIVGAVGRPGVYTVEPGTGLLPALAAAGGLNEFANPDRIFVLHPGGQETVRIRFRLEKLQRAEGAAATFRLQSGDQIVVE